MAKRFEELVKKTASKRTLEKARKRTQELLGELLISEMRRLRGLTQREVAQSLGIRQPSLAKLEKQPDMQISTLKRIVAALGGELEVVARFPKGGIKVEPFGSHSSSRMSRSRSTRSIPAELHLV